MNLHEYQAKQLLAKFGLPIPKGLTASSVEQVLLAVNSLNTAQWAVKAQIHAGGRGKVGGVKVVKDKAELEAIARTLLHTRLMTAQTHGAGQPINEVLIEEVSEIARELYLGMVIDRSVQNVVLIASTEGGVEIEQVAKTSPNKILKLSLDPFLGVMPYQCRALALKFELNDLQTKQFIEIVSGLYKLFIEYDLSLIEINPLVVTKQKDLMCLDAKITVDDNALFRQPLLRSMQDPSQEDTRELLARKWELNYIFLGGDIGCMVNGAGLAMATMDLIKLQGGEPANFLDVGGGATEERVKEAFKIILSDQDVKAILVNIFGGIVRCDLIAQGIMSAISEVSIKVPVVVRLEGNHAHEANEMLNKSGLNILAANNLNEAAEKVVKAARGTV